MTGLPWQAQNENSVVAITQMTWTDEWQKVKPGAVRLWCILISETAYMI